MTGEIQEREGGERKTDGGYEMPLGGPITESHYSYIAHIQNE